MSLRTFSVDMLCAHAHTPFMNDATNAAALAKPCPDCIDAFHACLPCTVRGEAQARAELEAFEAQERKIAHLKKSAVGFETVSRRLKAAGDHLGAYEAHLEALRLAGRAIAMGA